MLFWPECLDTGDRKSITEIQFIESSYENFYFCVLLHRMDLVKATHATVE